MKFHLYYRGNLKSNGSAREKQRLRISLHPQLSALWEREPLLDHTISLDGKKEELTKQAVLETVGKWTFCPVITPLLRLRCELDILILMPGKATGAFAGGDIDNRLKTLLDALRCPQNKNEVRDVSEPPSPLCCLMKDDSLIDAIRIECDTLLDAQNESELLFLVQVNAVKTAVTWGNVAL